MASELFAAKYRTFAGIFVENIWAIAVCVFAGLAYLVPNWVHLQLIISLFGLLTIPLYWYNLHFCIVCLSQCLASTSSEIVEQPARCYH